MGTNLEYYCEYYYAFGQWELIGVKTQSGYYCPVEPASHAPGQEGEIIMEHPWPIGSGADFPDQEFFVEYEFRNGQFHVRQANCPEGFSAPPDPMEFAKSTGVLRVFPARIKQKPSAEQSPGGGGKELA